MLGTLISFAVLTNVIMLNFAYDVPRKIYTIHLILMCLFLLLPDMRRLLDLFVFNRKVQLSSPVPLFKDKLLNKGVLLPAIGVGIGAIIVCGNRGMPDAARTRFICRRRSGGFGRWKLYPGQRLASAARPRTRNAGRG